MIRFNHGRSRRNLPQRSALLFEKVRQVVPVVADQHVPQPRDGGRQRPGPRPAGGGEALPAWLAVQLPGTITLFRKAIMGDIHRVNKLTEGVNVTPEESRDDVDSADGDQQGEPADRSNRWYTGGVLNSGSVGDEVRRWEGELPSMILSRRVVKSISSSFPIG